MARAALITRNAVALTVALMGFGASLVFGLAGTAHAHGTWSPPIEPPPTVIHPHRGPFAVLHGPFSVLHQQR